MQECKALNGRLLNFLLQPSTIEQLITYLTVQSPLPPDLEEAEVQKRWSKFPFAACEVFCCEVDAIFSTLFSNEDLMAKLFSIVDLNKTPDITLSGYFARVVKVLLVKRNSDMMSYLRQPKLAKTDKPDSGCAESDARRQCERCPEKCCCCFGRHCAKSDLPAAQ